MKHKLYHSIKKTFKQWTSWINLPDQEERTQFMNQRILSQLQEVGVAAQDDVNHLKKRIQKLELVLAEHEKQLHSTRPTSVSKKKTKPSGLYT